MFDQEKRWLQRIQKYNDEECANLLIQKYYKEIFAYTYKKVFDQQLAMDLTQEIFMRSLQSIHHFDVKKASFRTWLYQIAQRHCIDYFRSKAYQSLKHMDSMPEIEQKGEDVVMHSVLYKQQINELQQVISTFEMESQQIIISKLLEDLTFHQIAEKLSIPLSTVKTKYYKALKVMQKELEVLEHEPARANSIS